MYKEFVVLALAFTHIQGHLAWPGGDFQAVQGLYIKPSGDGTTGDLYVAATEDNGVSSQWLTDKPINFLAAGSHLQPTTAPLFSALSSNALPLHESFDAQKRSAITGPAAKYAYGLPESTYTSYGYAGFQSPKSEAAPVTATTPETATIAAGSAVPQYPYSYLYPHMVHAAYASALKVLKDAGISNDDGSKSNAITPYPTSFWPASYYPMQYLVMDPSAGAKKQADVSLTTTTAATPEDSEEENTKPE